MTVVYRSIGHVAGTHTPPEAEHASVKTGL
jgi:hypothetical protein